MTISLFGEYFDSETGNIYLRARYYDKSVGRFISEDLVKDGMNWYVYCANDPINYKDPTGYVKEGDKERFGEDSIKYKMLVYLGNAWNAAKTQAEKDALHNLPSNKWFKEQIADLLISGLKGYTPSDAVQDFKSAPNYVLKYDGKIHVGSNSSQSGKIN